MEVRHLTSRPGLPDPEKLPRYPLEWRLGELQTCSGRFGEQTKTSRACTKSENLTQLLVRTGMYLKHLIILTLLWYHGVNVTPVLFDSRSFLNCHEY